MPSPESPAKRITAWSTSSRFAFGSETSVRVDISTKNPDERDLPLCLGRSAAQRNLGRVKESTRETESHQFLLTAVRSPIKRIAQGSRHGVTEGSGLGHVCHKVQRVWREAGIVSRVVGQSPDTPSSAHLRASAPPRHGGQGGRQSLLRRQPRPRASHCPSEHRQPQTRQEGWFPAFVENGPVPTPGLRWRYPNPAR